MLIYKILRADEWAQLQSKGTSTGAPIDVADGYIHISTGEQVAETLARHFAGEDGLMLLALESEALGTGLLWEPSRGGALFPHLYGPLRLFDVIWSRPIALNGAVHELPVLG
ncbi:MAG: DUF952 domain-containing protein [Rhodobacteraceae bacterium]|nr:DUF952 domain-containing protein [Paracoccaceae bacterium]